MTSCGEKGVSTRKQTEIWLIGQMSSCLRTTKLPSKKEVMALFFTTRRLKSKPSEKLVIQQQMTFWKCG